MSKMPFKRGDILNVHGDIGIVSRIDDDVIWLEFLFENNWTQVPGKGYPFSLHFDYKFRKLGEIDLPTED